MADFKGFGSKPPELSPITLAEVNEAEMDRSMRFFLRQGCSRDMAVEEADLNAISPLAVRGFYCQPRWGIRPTE